MHKLVLSVSVLLLVLVAAPQAGAMAPPARAAQLPSCGNFESFGTQTASAIPFQLFYQLFSRGGAYDAVLAWGDGAETLATVNASNTPDNPVVVNNTYSRFGTFTLSISTTGTLSDGTACSDSNVPIGTVVITPPGPVSCGSFRTFDPTNPPGTLRLDAGDGITYTLESHDATLQTGTVDWGDGTSNSLPGPLAPNNAFEFPQPPPHTYARPGTYEVFLSVTGQLGNGASCTDRVKIGTVVVARKPLSRKAAKRKCDRFLRKAGGRVGRIIRRATSKPRTKCGAAKGSTRTCTTTVVITRRCGCRYIIKTRVPATGKPKVIKVTRKRLRGGGRPS